MTERLDRIITLKTLRDVEWKQIYAYAGVTSSFVTFGCDTLPGITITHERVQNMLSKSKVVTHYTVQTERGPRRADNPTFAVRLYNEESRQIAKRRKAQAHITVRSL